MRLVSIGFNHTSDRPRNFIQLHSLSICLSFLFIHYIDAHNPHNCLIASVECDMRLVHIFCVGLVVGVSSMKLQASLFKLNTHTKLQLSCIHYFTTMCFISGLFLCFPNIFLTKYSLSWHVFPFGFAFGCYFPLCFMFIISSKSLIRHIKFQYSIRLTCHSYFMFISNGIRPFHRRDNKKSQYDKSQSSQL